MSLRYYANAPATTLTSSCTAASTLLVVASNSGLPIQYPYTLILDRGLATEEAVSVTSASGLNLTVTRGIDGTTAFGHATGATVEHGITAQDVREPNTHIAATSGVHGLTGALVGTSDSQTLTNKSISADTNTLDGLAASSFVVSDAAGKIDGSAAQKIIPSGAVVGTSDAQTLTNKTISVDDNIVSGLAASSFALSNGSGNLDGSAAQKVIPAGAVVGTTDTQTLTNKNLTDSTNIFPANLANFVAWNQNTADVTSTAGAISSVVTTSLANASGLHVILAQLEVNNNTAGEYTLVTVTVDTGSGPGPVTVMESLKDHRASNRREGVCLMCITQLGVNVNASISVNIASSSGVSTARNALSPAQLVVFKVS